MVALVDCGASRGSGVRRAMLLAPEVQLVDSYAGKNWKHKKSNIRSQGGNTKTPGSSSKRVIWNHVPLLSDKIIWQQVAWTAELINRC